MAMDRFGARRPLVHQIRITRRSALAAAAVTTPTFTFTEATKPRAKWGEQPRLLVQVGPPHLQQETRPSFRPALFSSSRDCSVASLPSRHESENPTTHERMTLAH